MVESEKGFLKGRSPKRMKNREVRRKRNHSAVVDKPADHGLEEPEEKKKKERERGW
jgi:hypothetical protein